MNERAQMPTAIILGAATGAIAGYLLLTARGRRLRSRIDLALDDLVRELRKLGRTLNKAYVAAAGGWQALNEAAGEGGRDASHAIRHADTDRPAGGDPA